MNHALRKLEENYSLMLKYPALQSGAGLLRTFIDNLGSGLDAPEVIDIARRQAQELDAMENKTLAQGTFATVLLNFVGSDQPGPAVASSGRLFEPEKGQGGMIAMSLRRDPFVPSQREVTAQIGSHYEGSTPLGGLLPGEREILSQIHGEANVSALENEEADKLADEFFKKPPPKSETKADDKDDFFGKDFRLRSVYRTYQR